MWDHDPFEPDPNLNHDHLAIALYGASLLFFFAAIVAATMGVKDYETTHHFTANAGMSMIFMAFSVLWMIHARKHDDWKE